MPEPQEHLDAIAQALSFLGRKSGFLYNGHSQVQGGYAALAALRDDLKHKDEALRAIRGWDMLDVAGDGPFWKRELDAALGSSAGREPVSE